MIYVNLRSCPLRLRAGSLDRFCEHKTLKKDQLNKTKYSFSLKNKTNKTKQKTTRVIRIRLKTVALFRLWGLLFTYNKKKMKRALLMNNTDGNLLITDNNWKIFHYRNKISSQSRGFSLCVRSRWNPNIYCTIQMKSIEQNFNVKLFVIKMKTLRLIQMFYGFNTAPSIDRFFQCFS